jgi:hypothetical protein
MNCIVSEAEDLPTQVDDAIDLLSQFRTGLLDPALHSRKPVLDFGTWRREGPAIFFRFPVELVSLAGELHVGIELSLYESSEASGA